MASNLTGWTSETYTVYEYVREHPGATARQASDQTGINRDAVNSRLDNLVAQRYLDRELSATRGGATKYTPSASSPASPPPASPKSERPRPPRRPKWVGPVSTAEQETPAAVRPRKGSPTPFSTSPAGIMGEPRQAPSRASAGGESTPLHSPAATPPPDDDMTRDLEYAVEELTEAPPARRLHRRQGETDADLVAKATVAPFLLELQPIELTGWTEEHGQIVSIDVPAQGITSQVYTSEPAPTPRPSLVSPATAKLIARHPAFIPTNGPATSLFLCKIDESHGPEASIRGYCAACLRRYGPIA